MTSPVDMHARFYEKDIPDVEEHVMVRVTKIADMGAYVELLEYGNIEGMILLSELSRRRIRSIAKLVRVGRVEVCVTTRVDKKQRYVDLSKRRVSQQDAERCRVRFEMGRAVNSILRHEAEMHDVPLQRVYEMVAWPLARRFGHAYEGLRHAVEDADDAFRDVEFEPADMRQSLLSNVRRRLTPQPVKIRTDIEVTCFHYDGINAIRDALTAGEALGSEKTPVSIQLVAPPLYVVDTTTTNKTRGCELLDRVVVAVHESIAPRGGEVTQKVPPRPVSEREERDLSTYMEQLERQNREVSGDSDNADGDDVDAEE